MKNAKRPIVLSLLTGALLLGWLAPAHAQGTGPYHARGPGQGWGSGLMLGVPLHTLNLNPDQQAQVKSILSTYRASARPIIQQLREAQGGLGDRLLAAGQLQAADLQSQLQQITQLRTQLLQLSAQATLDVRSILTPDQLSTAAQTKAKMKDLRSQMHQILVPGTGTQP
jgi:Spy/CpxP family protein refolding chaperone